MLFDATSSNIIDGVGQLMTPPEELKTSQGCLEFYYNAYGSYR